MRTTIAIGLVAAVLATACGGSTEGMFGQELYETSCAACHGEGGQGAGNWPPVGAGSPSVALSDEQLVGVIRVGPGTMPGYSRLTDGQVDSLVAYLRELQGVAP
jgi:mono/diheme cytochrome c family protein